MMPEAKGWGNLVGKQAQPFVWGALYAMGGVGVLAATWAFFFPPCLRQAGSPALGVFWEIRGTPRLRRAGP